MLIMKLIKDFLTQAHPQAAFFQGDTLMTDALWQTYECHDEVGVSFDSRNIASGDLFVPLPGSTCDGHDFIEAALKNGASGSLLSCAQQSRLQKLPKELKANKLFIIIPDVQQALCALAIAWRQQLACPVVGITGSVGKTSTKEMLRSILKAAGINFYVSFKNYNNVLGVAYNLLRIPSSAVVAVIEMGINDVGEMRELVELVRPTVGLVTCIGHVHTQGLGNSLAAVAQEKCELFSQFAAHDVGIVYGDQPCLAQRSYAHKIAYFGMRKRNDVHAGNVRVVPDEQGAFTTEFIVHWYGQKAKICMRGNHPSVVHNALAASTVAYFLSLPLQAVVAGLEAYQGTEGRFEIKKIKDNRGMLLDDCYNASPESMRAALQAFARFKTDGPKIAVLGDMLELGAQELRWHRAVGRFIATKISGVNYLILVGTRARAIRAAVPSSVACSCVQDWHEAATVLEKLLLEQTGALVLVKASHGMHLDRLVHNLVC